MTAPQQCRQQQRHQCLHEMFQVSAAAFPKHLALVYRDRRLTYAQLDALTDDLANWLYQQGVGVGSIVGIFMERCDWFVVAYIAALKTGAAYMPIETAYPNELLTSSIAKAKPTVVLSTSRWIDRLPPTQLNVAIDTSNAFAGAPAMPSTRERATARSMAYVVMSSGTTGAPKGICCPHAGAVHSYNHRLQRYPYADDDRVAASVFFVWEMLRPLLGGLTGTPAQLYVVPDEVIYDPLALLDFLYEHRITRILFTPSLLQLMLDAAADSLLQQKLQRLRIVWICGEVVSVELARSFTRLLPKCQLENLYSISECHDVSYAPLNAIDTSVSPMYAPCGSPLPGVRIYILDDGLAPVQPGESGRIYIGGPCLALGYLDDPQQTAKRFIVDPFIEGETMYDTGDSGRMLPGDAGLELIGRVDFFVKIRGYSVVIGAVEVAISEHPLVSAAVVLTSGTDATADKTLVAYVVPASWDALPTVQELKDFLSGKLPPYAVPTQFELIDAVPVSVASGKLDRAKLPIISLQSLQDGRARTLSAEDLPVSQAEVVLADIWAALLNVDVKCIGRGSDFFNIGGHSLLLARMVRQARAQLHLHESQLSIADVLSHSTLADLALVCVTHDRSRQDIVDLRAEAAALDTCIYPAPTRNSGYSRFRRSALSVSPRCILLTGATGFLGAHILARLLSHSTTTVYCLVRASDKEAARARLVHTLQQYQLQQHQHLPGVEDALEHRVEVIVGDLSKPLLGLEYASFKGLAGEIDAIIHNGAQVNLIKSYGSLKPANVLGTQEVLRLAVTNGYHKTCVKPVHFVSTNGVFASSVTGKCHLESDDIGEECDGLASGYAQSKWVAERLCVEARRRGLPVSIFRPGNMSPSSVTLAWNRSDMLYLLLSACLQLGCAPSSPSLKLDLTPVDYAAAALVHCAVTRPSVGLGQGLLHLQSPHEPLPFDDVVAALALESVPLQMFRERLEAALAETRAKVLAMVEPSLDTIEEYMNTPDRLGCARLRVSLADTEIRCPKVQGALLARYLSTVAETAQ